MCPYGSLFCPRNLLEVIHLIKLLEALGQWYHLGAKAPLLESEKRNSTTVVFIPYFFTFIKEYVWFYGGGACQALLRRGDFLMFYQAAK